MTIDERNQSNLKRHLQIVIALQRAMETMLHSDDRDNVWKYASYKRFARKYMHVVALVGSEITLPPILDFYDVDKIPGSSHTVAMQQKELFEDVYANLSLLRAFLESEADVLGDQIQNLRDFLQSRLRSAIFDIPERERNVQDAIEQLLIGRGLQKGQDYDRETGRVKLSVKESVPDFVVWQHSLAIEVKLVKSSDRSGRIVDEISADITAYSKRYHHLLFLVYDVGHIRDEMEFRFDLESAPNVSVVIVKH